MNIERLYELMADRKLVPFLGAGFSIPSGLPSWQQLVSGLLSTCVSTKQSENIAKLSSQLGNTDSAELIDLISPTDFAAKEYLVEQVHSEKFKPSDYHSLLFSMRPDIVITTNWDVLIETYLSQVGIPHKVIYRDSQISQYDPDKAVQIVKVHGTIEEPDSLVYRRGHYRDFWNQRPLLLNLVCHLMATRSFLFMGYGFGDPNVVELFELLRERLGGFRREHYALVVGCNKLDDHWQRLGVTRIEAFAPDGASQNTTTAVKQFLVSLSGRTQSVPLSNLERAKLVNRELLRLIRRMPPLPVLRMRGSLGWLSNPKPDPDDPIYGSFDQDQEEYMMTTNIRSFLEASASARVKCLLTLQVEPLLLAGYKPQHIVRRLQAVLFMMEQFPSQIEIAKDTAPSSLNHMLFDLHSTLLGFKQTGAVGIRRSFWQADRNRVRAEADHFDADFDFISTKNMDEAEKLGIQVAEPTWRFHYIELTLREQIARSNQFAQTYALPSFEGLDLYSKALEFALNLHQRFQQTREDGVTPFGVHIVRVVERLREVGKVTDWTSLAAAALHDVVEDCEVRIDTLELVFGREVAAIVAELTRPVEQNCADFIEQLRRSSIEAKAIKLADRWDNVTDLRLFGKEDFGGISAFEYIEESKEIVASCGCSNVALTVQLQLAIAEAENSLRAKGSELRE